MGRGRPRKWSLAACKADALHFTFCSEWHGIPAKPVWQPIVMAGQKNAPPIRLKLGSPKDIGRSKGALLRPRLSGQNSLGVWALQAHTSQLKQGLVKYVQRAYGGCLVLFLARKVILVDRWPCPCQRNIQMQFGNFHNIYTATYLENDTQLDSCPWVCAFLAGIAVKPFS